MPRTKPEVILTGEQESIRAFVKGAVAGSLLAANTDKMFNEIGWQLEITGTGVPIFTAPSGDRYAVGVVKL